MTNRTIAEAFHPSIFIQDEMDARGWTRDDLAWHMGGDFSITRISLDFYFAIHDRNMRMGNDWIRGFAKAFGTSEDCFRNLERAWIDHPSSEVPTTAPDLRLVHPFPRSIPAP